MPALFGESLALWLALVFGAAAVGKALAWSEWPGVVANFRVLPRFALPLATALLPPFEALLALALPPPASRPYAAAAAAALLLVFAAAIGVNLRRGRREIDCGCFRSALRQPLSAALVLRNLVLAGAALALLAPPAGGGTLAPLAWLLAAGAALTLFLCHLSTGILFGPPPPAPQPAGRSP